MKDHLLGIEKALQQKRDFIEWVREDYAASAGEEKVAARHAEWIALQKEREEREPVYFQHIFPLLPPFERLAWMLRARYIKFVWVEAPLLGGRFIHVTSYSSFVFLPDPKKSGVPRKEDLSVMADLLMLPKDFVENLIFGEEEEDA